MGSQLGLQTSQSAGLVGLSREPATLATKCHRGENVKGPLYGSTTRYLTVSERVFVQVPVVPRYFPSLFHADLGMNLIKQG